MSRSPVSVEVQLELQHHSVILDVDQYKFWAPYSTAPLTESAIVALMRADEARAQLCENPVPFDEEYDVYYNGYGEDKPTRPFVGSDEDNDDDLPF